MVGLFLAFALLLVNGLVSFALAIGYLDGGGWAWTLGIIFGLINIVGSVVEILVGLPISIVGIIFSAVIIVYLTRPSVRAFFGRGLPMTLASQSGQSALPMASGLTSWKSSMARPCQQCGAIIPAGAGFCRACGTVQ